MPAVEVPESLAFADNEQAAADDFYAVPVGQSHLTVLTNDVLGARTIIISVTQPDTGTVRIENDELVLELPADHPAAPVTFTYTIQTGTTVDTATVHVSPQPQLSWDRGDITFLESSETAFGSTDEDQPSPSRSPLSILTRPPAIWLALVDLQLPLLSGLSAASFLLVLLAVASRRGRRRRFVSVQGVHRDNALTVHPLKRFDLRHDAEELWSTGRVRRRTGEIEVETPNGVSWVADAGITPTDRRDVFGD